MAKTTGWKVIATAGATVDGRVITEAWINDMASAYSQDEYTALIWPEHKRSGWDLFEGKNWGIVESLKAEKLNDVLRLFAKITPNAYLLKANKEGQKLFTSIEPEPDYKGKGTCYLMGLAVTDSPASSGTTRLQFSTGNGTEKNIECSQLEEIDFSECYASNPISKAIATLADYFSSGGKLSELERIHLPQENDPMNQEQFNKMMGKLDGIEAKQTELESAQSALAGKVNKFSIELPEEAPAAEPQLSAAQFSAELKTLLEPITEKVTGLETQFNKLSQEVPGQRPAGEGAGETTVEAF